MLKLQDQLFSGQPQGLIPRLNLETVSSRRRADASSAIIKLRFIFFSTRRTHQYLKHVVDDRKLIYGLFDRRCGGLIQIASTQESLFDYLIKKLLIIAKRLIAINVWIA